MSYETASADHGESGEGRPLYYLVAAAGHPNLGDELIAAGWLRYLANIAPEADVWVDTNTPGPAAVLLAGLHPRVRFTDTLWRLCQAAPSDDPWQVASWLQDTVADPEMAPRYRLGIHLLTNADVLHLIGGGYINTMWPRHLGLVAGVAAAARLTGARAVMTGQGLAPVDADCIALVRGLVADFDVVDVRDEMSAAVLGIAGGVDDVFLDPRSALCGMEDVPEVMLCLQADLVDAGIGKLAAVALATMQAWNISPDNIGFVEAIPGQDRQVYALLRHEFPGARFYSFHEIWQRGLPASQSQVWLSSRFHIHLLGAIAGARGVALSVLPGYYSVKHRSLADLGSGWTVLEDLSQVPAMPDSGGFDTELVEQCHLAKIGIAKRVYEDPRDDFELCQVDGLKNSILTSS
ncbi:polysaccharide pyruvyl transferase family protein [Amycolatopsis acidiphila]|uniref:Polysaccharide pyruvyl transferase family protein n=1 Tax=Amycolatopsis acidiphila TaxID=715473 RepID=A0A558AF20_9PSEU|nr:polysaccharide pyruvyl transferase family protein [Amycolatopsis acidiphila]TVT22852.1 polysaccharide pyruvyl transferase family protein [Amycolatopsis acidiphila]UIJ58136.1 polysaccharide pyruvyl transferase family protein [Amycolatopsis acidiphila]GHG69856.1 hypothetical protein GCM10017788_30410 [Amycolatopsis acidiphila]